MYKTKAFKTDEKITVDINGLQEMLSIGKNTATQIGRDAGAVVEIGKRRLYNVEKIKRYIDSLTH